MCEFCESLNDNKKEIVWSVRSTMVDDNICEIVNNDQCSCCGDCSQKFVINGYIFDDENQFISLKYFQEVSSDKEKVIIHPFSEAIQFNFCPFCGEQISKTIKPFENNFEHQIHISEK